jgi:transcriptional regulator with XRE-family HTH domain
MEFVKTYVQEMKSVGRELKFARERKGYTQAKLAELIGRKKIFVSHVEQGHKLPPVELVAVYCRTVGYPLDKLIELKIRIETDYMRESMLHGIKYKRAVF